MGEAEDVGAVAAAVEAEAEAHHLGGEVWDGVANVQGGAGVVGRVLEAEQEVGEGEETEDGVARGGAEEGPRGDASEVAGQVEVEARAGCLE